MPLYSYRCPACRGVFEKFAHHDDTASRLDTPTCPNCHIRTKRVFGFSSPETFEPHYNYSAGAYVTSKRDLMNKLKVNAAERSERLGIPHTPTLIDRAEVKPEELGVTDHGMKETHDRAVAEGRKPPTGKITF